MPGQSLRRLAHADRYALNSQPENPFSFTDALENELSTCFFDLTTVARFGLRGVGSVEWFASQGLTVPTQLNKAARNRDGSLVLRLGDRDIVAIGNPESEAPDDASLRNTWLGDPTPVKGFDSYRDDGWAWFAVAGQNGRDVLAKICGVDLDECTFDVLDIAQTRVAHMNAVLVRSDRWGSGCFDILFDVTAADFFLDVIAEAGMEFGTAIYGRTTFADMAGSAEWRKLH